MIVLTTVTTTTISKLAENKKEGERCAEYFCSSALLGKQEDECKQIQGRIMVSTAYLAVICASSCTPLTLLRNEKGVVSLELKLQ